MGGMRKVEFRSSFSHPATNREVLIPMMRLTRSVCALTGGLLVLFLTVDRLRAQTTAADVIYACVQKSSQQVRIISAAESCRSLSTEGGTSRPPGRCSRRIRAARPCAQPVVRDHNGLLSCTALRCPPPPTCVYGVLDAFDKPASSDDGAGCFFLSQQHPHRSQLSAERVQD